MKIADKFEDNIEIKPLAKLPRIEPRNPSTKPYPKRLIRSREIPELERRVVEYQRQIEHHGQILNWIPLDQEED